MRLLRCPRPLEGLPPPRHLPEGCFVATRLDTCQTKLWQGLSRLRRNFWLEDASPELGTGGGCGGGSCPCWAVWRDLSPLLLGERRGRQGRSGLSSLLLFLCTGPLGSGRWSPWASPACPLCARPPPHGPWGGSKSCSGQGRSAGKPDGFSSFCCLHKYSLTFLLQALLASLLPGLAPVQPSKAGKGSFPSWRQLEEDTWSLPA